MNMKEKKLLIISKFIDLGSARFSVENKGRSIFSFFKKKSKEASFIDELTSFFNKNSNADAEDSKFEEKLNNLLGKYNDLPLTSQLTDTLSKASSTSDEKNNQIKVINFDFESFKSQMGIVFDSLKKLKKVTPLLSKVTKRANVILAKIYKTIGDTITSNKLNEEQSNNVYENLQEVQEIVPSTISSRLIKNSKHFEDKDEVNSTLSNVYDEFSKLNQILFGSPFKKLNDNIDNITKGNQLDKSDGTDKTKLSYYINLVDSDMSKLKKCKLSRLNSADANLDSERSYAILKDEWSNLSQILYISKLSDEKFKNDLKGKLVVLISKFDNMLKNCEKFDKVKLETKEDLQTLNLVSNTIIDIRNEMIEIYELLFESNSEKKTYTKIQHVNYSEADFENAKNSNFKTVAIIFKFINAESAKLALGNKGRSMFSRKSSEESFIDELNNLYNKYANDNKKFDKYLDDILSRYEKEDKCPNMVKKLRDQIKGINQSDNKEIKDFDKIELENQLKEVDDSLRNLKKVIPIFSKVTKRTYTMLSKIYNNIKLNIEQNKDEKQKSAIIYDSLNEVKTLIPSSISSRLVKKSKRFGDESKVNKALSDVYDEFSNLNNILFDSTFEKLDSTKIDNNAKFDTSDGTDKTRVSYYINLADSDMSKLKKYRSSDFWSIVQPSPFEQFYDDSKDRWNKVKKDLDTNKTKNESLEIVFHELISHFKSGFEFYGTFEHIDLKTTEDIDKYNEAVNILVDLNNDIIEIYELLFESNSDKKTYTRIKHVNYSEIEGIHGEAYDEKNIKKIKMKDKNGKEVIKYFVKRSGDHIQGKVIYSGFLFDYADVDPEDLDKQIRKNSKLNLDEKYKHLKDIFNKKLGAFNKTKAGEYGVRIIATAEGLGGKNMSSGIDDSYNIAEASVVEVSTKIISKKIKIRVYVACKALTISQMLFGKKPEGDLANMLATVPAGVFGTINSGSKTALSIKNCLSPGKLKLLPVEKSIDLEEERKLLESLKSQKNEAENMKKTANENLEKLKDEEWDPRTKEEMPNIVAMPFFGKKDMNLFSKTIEKKREEVKEESESTIKKAERISKKYLTKKAEFDRIADPKNKQKNVDARFALKGDYLLANVPILKSDVKLPKENENEEGIVAQKESWMNPGKIWFTMSMSSGIANDKIQEVLESKDKSDQVLNLTDDLACVSDIFLDIQAVVKMKIQMRLYISLNKTISSIAKNLVDIKLKTPKGKIELN